MPRPRATPSARAPCVSDPGTVFARSRESLALALFLAAQIAAAMPSTRARPPHVTATRAPTPPTIDGELDDAVWRLSPSTGDFTQRIPEDGAAPRDPTRVHVLYDDDAIYVGVDCPQTHAPVTERLTRRDRAVEVDSVTIALGTRGDHRSAFEFSVNVSGTLSDAIRFNDTDYSADWDENWEARTSIRRDGYSVEIRIPLRVLRFPTLPAQSWDFQATRYVSATQETDVWSYAPRSVAGEVSRYGRLEIPGPLTQKYPIELRPFVTGRARRRDPGQGELASGWDARASGGLDLKWHPTPGLTLDATFNPDFAQVEADQVVLNLTTYETYYPEKRPFFLEGIEAFATPFQLLYTRRIGRVPLAPPLRIAELLVDLPEPSVIYGAAKLSGSLGKGWSVGTVQAVTGENDVQAQLPNGTSATRLVDPLSTFDVVRVKREVGDRAHVALMATAVTHAEPTEFYPLQPGPSGGPNGAELCPNPVALTPLVQASLTPSPRARCFNDAYVGAIDWQWRSPGGEYTTGGQVVGSILKNGPVRPVADGTQIKSGDAGWGVQAYLEKQGGKHWLGVVRTDVESTKLEINDLGYNARANQINAYARVQYQDLEPRGAFRERFLYSSVRANYDNAGLPIGTTAYVVAFARFRNLWTLDGDLHYVLPRYDDREVGDGTALEHLARPGTEFELATDATKRVALSLDSLTEVAANSVATSGSATLTVRALPQLDFDLLPMWQWTKGEPRFAERGALGGTYVFGRLEAASVGVTLRTTYTFTPRLTLQAYAQLFLSSGHYSSFSDYLALATGPRPVVHVADLAPYSLAPPTNPDFEQGVLNVNVVLRWEYALGSTLYLVYTRSQSPVTVLGANDVATLDLGALGRAPTSDAILAKLTYWWGG